MRFPFHATWPPSMLVVGAVLLIGVALLVSAIALRRKYGSRIVATLMLVVAALWNGAIVFAFMSPHNRHVFHLSTHRSSVVVNAIVGIAWLSVCVLGLNRRRTQ
jgi:ABC-type Na+ efflux pump permease subunit